MASVGVDLCKYLRSQSSIAAKVGRAVFHRHVPQPAPRRFIYVVRTGLDNERCLGESGDPAFRHRYTAEAIADTETEADAIADLIRAIDGASGTFGGRTVQAVFVDDQADDYEPKGIGSDLGYHIAAVSIEVIP